MTSCISSRCASTPKNAAIKGATNGLKALNRALEGVTGTTIVHICFGYAAVVAVVVERVRRALPYAKADNIIIAPD